MITITLNKIKEHGPCEDGWKKLLKSQGKTKADDVEFPLTDVLESNGLDDALWCLRCLPEHNATWRLLAVRFARGEATDDELTAAGDAAWAAARDAARDAWAAAWDAARDAARAAGDAAWDAARAKQEQLFRAALEAA